MHGEITIAAHGVPGSGAGTTVLKPVPAGSSAATPRDAARSESRWWADGSSSYIADLIAKEVPEMQRFTTEWISGNA